MAEWINWLINWLFRRTGGADDRADLRKDLTSFRGAYNDLMKQYQIMAQELRTELDNLKNEVASLTAALDAERESHKQCRRELDVLHAEMRNLKGRVDVMQDQRKTDH